MGMSREERAYERAKARHERAVAEGRTLERLILKAQPDQDHGVGRNRRLKETIVSALVVALIRGVAGAVSGYLSDRRERRREAELRNSALALIEAGMLQRFGP